MRTLIFLLTLFVFACQNQPETAPDKILSLRHPTALRQQASEKSAELEQLRPAHELLDLGKVSQGLSGIYFGDSLYLEPWLLVRTSSEKTGWVFAGAVQLARADAAQQQEWTLSKRFEACFGAPLTQAWQQWRAEPPGSADSTFARHLQRGFALRDTVNLGLTGQVSRDPAQYPIDFFWLEKCFPFFQVQYLGAANQFALFADFRQIGIVAQKTAGTQDDLFVSAAVAAFPLDSIESPFPAWVFPLSLEASASNLGAGKHLSCLQTMHRAWQAGPAFRPALRQLTEQLLADILDGNREYWQPQTLILAELGAILNGNFANFNHRDRLALQARYAMFEQPEANGIRLNLRTGG